MSHHHEHPHPHTAHVHTYDAEGKQTCCTLEDKIEAKTAVVTAHDEHDHDHAHGSTKAPWREYLPAIVSLVLLLSGILLDYYFKPAFFTGWVRFAWYLVAYLPVGLPVLKEAWEAMRKGSFFTEFLLMSIATVGAFSIREYPEGVAVMLFYTIGELFQTAAVRRAKGSIKALLDVRPDRASVLRDGQFQEVHPETVQTGDTIRVRPGERVPLDGILLSPQGSFDTAALTGEARPRTFEADETVLAGMVSLDAVVEMRVSKPFAESSIARILDLVQNASARKAPTELFIRKFARIYTPVVVLLATLLVVVPYFVLADYVFRDWLYRALVFLVISCPCALVISIPLGYFGGIGAASRQGILFKGSNFLDLITKVNTVVMDKTGTLTKGVFKVIQVVPGDGVASSHPVAPPGSSPPGEVVTSSHRFTTPELLRFTAALEQHSTHPVARAILAYADEQNITWRSALTEDVRETAGQGLSGTVDGCNVLAGNTKLLQNQAITYPTALDAEPNTIAVVAVDGRYTGFFVIADEIKPDALQTVQALQQAGIQEIVMLSGDKNTVVQQVASTLGIRQGFGDLLPEDKVEKVEALKRENPRRVVAFMGDGINDAPVLAVSDVGIAMGGLGSDAAIETADVVIQTDQPSKLVAAMEIGRATRRVVWQNIGLAFGVKALVLLLGAGGLATMWEAVFADVGVALLAILNSYRIQRVRDVRDVRG